MIKLRATLALVAVAALLGACRPEAPEPDMRWTAVVKPNITIPEECIERPDYPRRPEHRDYSEKQSLLHARREFNRTWAMRQRYVRCQKFVKGLR